VSPQLARSRQASKTPRLDAELLFPTWRIWCSASPNCLVT